MHHPYRANTTAFPGSRRGFGSPSLLQRLKSAPFSSRVEQRLTWPAPAAQWRGVSEREPPSVTSARTPAWSKQETITSKYRGNGGRACVRCLAYLQPERREVGHEPRHFYISTRSLASPYTSSKSTTRPRATLAMKKAGSFRKAWRKARKGQQHTTRYVADLVSRRGYASSLQRTYCLAARVPRDTET